MSDSRLALATTGVQTLAQAVQAASQSGILTRMQSHLSAAATRAALNEAHPHLCFNALACLADCGAELASAGAGMPGYVCFPHLLLTPVLIPTLTPVLCSRLCHSSPPLSRPSVLATLAACLGSAPAPDVLTCEGGPRLCTTACMGQCH